MFFFACGISKHVGYCRKKRKALNSKCKDIISLEVKNDFLRLKYKKPTKNENTHQIHTELNISLFKIVNVT